MTLSRYTNIISSGWVGLNLINQNQNDYLLQNFICYNKNNRNSALSVNSVSYCLNKDISPTGSVFSIYQGHHGDDNTSFANMLLPSTSFIEKNALYCNLYGFVQKTKKVLFNVANSRDDWKILTAVGHFFGFSSFFPHSSVDIVSCLARVSPNALFITDNSFFIPSFKLGTKHFSQVKSYLNNFYISDSITKNSKIMSLCSSRFKSYSYNFFS